MKRTEVLETYSGAVRLFFSDRYMDLHCRFRVFQDYEEEVPTLKHATGAFTGLSNGDAAHATLAATPLDLETDDGRKAKVLITDVDGRFTLSGLTERPR